MLSVSLEARYCVIFNSFQESFVSLIVEFSVTVFKVRQSKKLLVPCKWETQQMNRTVAVTSFTVLYGSGQS